MSDGISRAITALWVLSGDGSRTIRFSGYGDRSTKRMLRFCRCTFAELQAAAAICRDKGLSAYVMSAP